MYDLVDYDKCPRIICIDPSQKQIHVKTIKYKSLMRSCGYIKTKKILLKFQEVFLKDFLNDE